MRKMRTTRRNCTEQTVRPVISLCSIFTGRIENHSRFGNTLSCFWRTSICLWLTEITQRNVISTSEKLHGAQQNNTIKRRDKQPPSPSHELVSIMYIYLASTVFTTPQAAVLQMSWHYNLYSLKLRPSKYTVYSHKRLSSTLNAACQFRIFSQVCWQTHVHFYTSGK